MQTETENSGKSSSFVHISLEANAEELFEIQAVSFNQHKRTGEVAEAAFLAKASNLGFCVAKPWGESERYDFIVDSGHHFWRVQVKSTHSRKRPSYRVRSVWGRTHVYSAAEIDFLVAYVAPEKPMVCNSRGRDRDTNRSVPLSKWRKPIQLRKLSRGLVPDGPSQRPSKA